MNPQSGMVGSVGLAALIDTLMAGTLAYFIQRQKMRDQITRFVIHATLRPLKLRFLLQAIRRHAKPHPSLLG